MGHFENDPMRNGSYYMGHIIGALVVLGWILVVFGSDYPGRCITELKDPKMAEMQQNESERLKYILMRYLKPTVSPNVLGKFFLSGLFQAL